ncbi:MAG TPA: glycosyltransferase [Thermoleophilaceae bacterium]
MQAPRASVLMAAYAAEATLPEAVASVLAQSVERLELIVADDRSPQPVAELLADVRDPRLRIVRRARNGGTARARNSALSVARAPVVCQLDADDRWEPDYLEQVLPAFDDPGIGLAYTNATILGHPTGHEDYVGNASIHPRDRFPELLDANPIPCPTVSVRTTAMRAVGGYSGWLRSVEDWNLYLRLAAAGWRFAYVDRQLAGYRWPEPTRGMSYDTRRLERWVIAALADLALRHPRTPGVWAALRARLRGYREGAGR